MELTLQEVTEIIKCMQVNGGYDRCSPILVKLTKEQSRLLKQYRGEDNGNDNTGNW